jgi:transcriptional regulator GlxA family with amidase domain
MVSRKTGSHSTPGKIPERKGSGLLVDSAKEYIMKNLHTKLTLGDIAWKVGKGEEHLARVFKKETGQSVFDFVREMRIEQAKIHLYDTSKSLTYIATATGFSSLSFFSRTFKTIAGMSPSQYRSHIETTRRPPA